MQAEQGGSKPEAPTFDLSSHLVARGEYPPGEPSSREQPINEPPS